MSASLVHLLPTFPVLVHVKQLNIQNKGLLRRLRLGRERAASAAEDGGSGSQAAMDGSGNGGMASPVVTEGRARCEAVEDASSSVASMG